MDLPGLAIEPTRHLRMSNNRQDAETVVIVKTRSIGLWLRIMQKRLVVTVCKCASILGHSLITARVDPVVGI